MMTREDQGLQNYMGRDDSYAEIMVTMSVCLMGERILEAAGNVSRQTCDTHWEAGK